MMKQPITHILAAILLLLLQIIHTDGFSVSKTLAMGKLTANQWHQQHQLHHHYQQQQLQQRSTSTGMSATQDSPSSVTEWVVENLETENATITTSSAVKAGENDTLPIEGLVIADYRIQAADAPEDVDNDDEQERDSDKPLFPIRLLLGRNGWGTGVHPSTRLCLEWLSSKDDHIQGGETFLDYGCGSGVLSIAALHAGCSRAIGVDIEAEALVTSERNLDLNAFGDRFEAFHTREIEPYGLCRPNGVDVCIANILVGQLTRPSMVAALSSNIAPGGLLCMSGIRPGEVDSLKHAYDDVFEWLEADYDELAAKDCPGSIDSYGFDCGTWSRLVGKRRFGDRQTDIERMSELAVQ